MLVLCLTLLSCSTGADSRINGKWRTEKEFRGVPMEVVTVKIDGKSISVSVIPKGRRLYNSGFGGSELQTFTGTYVEGNKFDLSNGITLDYNDKLDRLYLKSEWGGQEYVRYEFQN